MSPASIFETTKFLTSFSFTLSVIVLSDSQSRSITIVTFAGFVPSAAVNVTSESETPVYVTSVDASVIPGILIEYSYVF